MRSQIPATGSSESESSQVFSSPSRKQESPSRKKESLAERVVRTRRHRASWQPPSPTTSGDTGVPSVESQSSQSKKSEPPELFQANTARNTSTEHRQDTLDTPKRKTMALAQAHNRKSQMHTRLQAPSTDDTKEVRAVIAFPMSPETKKVKAVIAIPKEARAVIAMPMDTKEVRPVIAMPLDTKEVRPVIATPMDTKEARPVIAMPMETKEVRPVIATPMDTKEVRPVIAMPMETKEVRAAIAIPMEKKSPSLHEKKMRAIARNRKSPSRTVSPATAAASGSLSKNKFFSGENPEKSVNEVVATPEADVGRKFASRYGQAASLSEKTAKPAASESQPAVTESLPRYFMGSSVPKVPTANRYRVNNNKNELAPAEEKREETEDVEPEGTAPKTSRAEIETPEKVNVAIPKSRYGVSLYKPLPVEQPKVQDVPVLKRSDHKASNVFQQTEDSKPHPDPTTQKPDPSTSSFLYSNRSRGEPIPVVPTPEPVQRPATWKPRSSTPSRHSVGPTWKPRSSTPSRRPEEPRAQDASSRRGQGPGEREEQVQAEIKSSTSEELRGQGAFSRREQLQGEQVHPEIKTNASIETPDKVSVSNVTAMFSHAGIKASEMKRAASAPRARPMMTSRYQPATKTPERVQNKNVNTIKAAQGSRGNVSRVDISTRSPKEAAVDHNEEIPTQESRAVIETPEKVSVSSMKGKFNTQGTPSFYRSNSPHNTPATPPKTVRPVVDVSTPHGPLPPQRALCNSVPTTTQSWKARSPSPNQPKMKPWMKQTPPASDIMPQRSASPSPYRNVSPLPPASHRTPSRRSTATEQQKPREVSLPPPLWESSDLVTETVAPKQSHIEPLSVELPQSPRDRPSSIPKWGKSTRPASPCSPSRRPSSIPTLPKREGEAQEHSQAESETVNNPVRETMLPKGEGEAQEHSQALREVSTPLEPVNNVLPDREINDSNPVRETIESVSRSSSPSPRNRERPWKRDLQVLSPRSWEGRWGSSVDVEEDYHQLKARHFPQSSSPRKQPLGSRTSLPVHQNHAVSEKRQQNTTPIESESYGEEKKTSNMEDDSPLASIGSMMSLTQMAANSIHAVDYEQAMSGLVKTSVSYDDEESNHSGGTGGTGGAIPVDLPPELAKAIAQDQASEIKGVSSEKPSNISEVTQLISKARALQAKALSREKLDRACHELNRELSVDSAGHNIVFGDPNTYGAAGGDKGQTPPRVADRARAIALWKGGLGVKPPPASKFDQIYDTAPSQSSRDDEQIDEPHSDVVFGDPKTYGAAGGEALNDSPRVAQRSHAIEEWTSSPSKSSDSKASAPAVKSPVFRGPVSSPKSPGAKVTLSAPSGGKTPGSAVMQLLATTSADELDDAHNWADKDPLLEDISATDMMDITPKLDDAHNWADKDPLLDDISATDLDVTPEELEEQLLGNADGFGFPTANWRTKTAGNSPPKVRVNNQAPDPFNFDAVAALSQRSTNNAEVKPQTRNAFDPFLDGVTDSPANFGGSVKFFKEETFPEPSFTPRAKEEFMSHEFEQGGTSTLAAPSGSSGEDSDPVVVQTKLGPPRRSRKSIEIDHLKKQRNMVTAKPKQRMIVTESTDMSELDMSLETELDLAFTVKTTEREATEMGLDPANLSDSLLQFDPWSYDANEKPKRDAFGFEI
jgi:hypothetical protein